MSVSRVGVGMYASTVSISSQDRLVLRRVVVIAGAFQRLQRRAANDRRVRREAVACQQLAQLQLDQFQQFRVVHLVGLVQVHDHRRNLDLTGQQDMLAGLRHRAVRRTDHQDRAIHLRRAGDHILDVVTVAGTVDVGIVPRFGLVLDVGDVDRDAARLLFGRVVDRVVGPVLGLPVHRQDFRDRRRQRGLTVIDVSDGPDVHMWLIALEFFLTHREGPPNAPNVGILSSMNTGKEPTMGLEPMTFPLPRECSTTELRRQNQACIRLKSC